MTEGIWIALITLGGTVIGTLTKLMYDAMKRREKKTDAKDTYNKKYQKLRHGLESYQRKLNRAAVALSVQQAEHELSGNDTDTLREKYETAKRLHEKCDEVEEMFEEAIDELMEERDIPDEVIKDVLKKAKEVLKDAKANKK